MPICRRWKWTCTLVGTGTFCDTNGFSIRTIDHFITVDSGILRCRENRWARQTAAILSQKWLAHWFTLFGPECIQQSQEKPVNLSTSELRLQFEFPSQRESVESSPRGISHMEFDDVWCLSPSLSFDASHHLFHLFKVHGTYRNKKNVF